MFSPSTFFDLSSFLFRELFDENAPVWETLKKIDTFLKTFSKHHIDVDIPQGAFLIDAHLITICEGTVVEPGAYIKGPCYIGKGCTVRHGAYVRGQVITGEHCVIGHDTEVKNTLLLNRAHAAHFAYLGDCILGNDVNLGAGTKCANLRLDNKEVVIHHERQHYPTGLRKFGAIIGDRSQIGCNAVTNPGSIIGQDVFCYPVVNIGGVIPAQTIAKASSSVVYSSRNS